MWYNEGTRNSLKFYRDVKQMEIHTVIQQRRKALGLTQEQVAEYLGVTAPAVNKWEKGVSHS